MITQLDIKNDLISAELMNLQRRSYAVEAELIAYFSIPYLTERQETLRRSRETFLGYRMNGELVGALGYDTFSDENSTQITRLVVSPNHFKKGIAGSLLVALEQVDGFDYIRVTTAFGNLPSVMLYKKHGYENLRNFTIHNELEMVELHKRLIQ